MHVSHLLVEQIFPDRWHRDLCVDRWWDDCTRVLIWVIMRFDVSVISLYERVSFRTHTVLCFDSLFCSLWIFAAEISFVRGYFLRVLDPATTCSRYTEHFPSIAACRTLIRGSTHIFVFVFRWSSKSLCRWYIGWTRAAWTLTKKASALSLSWPRLSASIIRCHREWSSLSTCGIWISLGRSR